MQLLDDPLCEQTPHHGVRRGYEGDEVVGRNATVDHDERDTFHRRLGDDRVERLSGVRADDQKVNSARYQVLDVERSVWRTS